MDADRPTRRRSISFSPSRVQYVRYPSITGPSPFKTPFGANRNQPLEADVLIARHDVTTPEIYFYSPTSSGNQADSDLPPPTPTENGQQQSSDGPLENQQAANSVRTNPPYQGRERVANMIRFEAKVVAKRVSDSCSVLDNDYKKAIIPSSNEQDNMRKFYRILQIFTDL